MSVSVSRVLFRKENEDSFFLCERMGSWIYVDTIAFLDFWSSFWLFCASFGYDIPRGLGIVFDLVGVITVALARDKLFLEKHACRMATVIQRSMKEE